MKKIVSSLIAGSFLFANLYNQIPKVKLSHKTIPLSFKTSMKNQIESVAISNNKVAIGSYYTEKIFDLNANLEKTFNYKHLKSLELNNNKLFILTDYYFYTYDLNNYKLLSNISRRYQDLDINKNLLGVVSNYYYATIYNIRNGKQISEFKIDGNWLMLSPNNQKLISGNKIYDINGNLLVDLNINFNMIDWIDNTNLLYVNNDQLYIINSKTSIKEGPFTKNVPKDIDKIKVINKNFALIFDNNKIRIFDIKNKKILTNEFTLQTAPNRDLNKMALKNNNLIVGYGDDAFIYNIASIMQSIGIINTNIPQISQKQIKTPQINLPKIKQEVKSEIKPKVVVKEKIVEKKIYVTKTQNKAPNLVVYASKTSGYVPLKVDFKILASDEDGKVVFYYMNFAGKEIMKKGSPDGKTLSYTFTTPGEYNVLVAIKDNNGAITKKQITIKVREETFEDYKKSIIGD